ncbi:MAG: 3-dehydroquinate synthase [Phycisphaerales bacterium]|nr:3-dehydroquinate synthase [Phycisphaerales bacterium]
MESIRINIPAVAASTYEVRIAPGLLGRLGEITQSLAPAPSAVIISDSNVAPRYLAVAKGSLVAAGYRVMEHVFPAGEENKTIQTAVEIFGAVLGVKGGGIERATPVIALGGGVVGDMAGFVAATVLRGVPFIQVPTTLLAAVDASVGGKVAVDHPTGKNLIGAFHQPKVVLTDIATFATLPPREFRSGLAECIKHAVIRDASLFAFIADNVARIFACDVAVLTELVARNVAIKAAIVHEDPFEKSVRALLNFGHTYGHAIENVQHYSGVTHGEAVALGMIAAAHLACMQPAPHSFPRDDLHKLIALLNVVGLPTSCPDLDIDRTLAAMSTDKKVRSGKLRFILPTHIGHAQVVTDIPPDLVRAALVSGLTR